MRKPVFAVLSSHYAALLLLALLIFVIGSNHSAWAQDAGPRAMRGTLTVIGQGTNSPDDVAVADDGTDNGTIYFSDITLGRVMRLNADGKGEIVSPAIREPEGIVPLPDGTLIVVEQATNRLLRVDPTSKTMSLFYAVGNKTANAGIDGISRDPILGQLLIPDAPTGRILKLATKPGSTPRMILSGFNRPTSIAESPDGILYICDEYGGKIYRATEYGRAKVLTANLSLPDDVIIDLEGHLLVNALNGTVWDIDPQTGRASPLVVGLSAPHGIALDKDGSVIIADATLNRIYRLTLPPSSLTQRSTF